MLKRQVKIVLITSVIILLSGCSGQDNVLWDDINAFKKENADLSTQVQTLQQENSQLNEQLDVLTGLDKDTRFKNLDTLDKIRINKRTRLYDLDENNTKETLVVYIEPIDTAQDTIKALGTIKVELWNLNNDSANAKLAEWILQPAELQKLWGGNIFTSYYRLPFEVAGVLSGQEKELTVKVSFTDLLSGKVLHDQTVITP